MEARLALLALLGAGAAPAFIWARSNSLIGGADFNSPHDAVNSFASIWSGWLDSQGTQGTSTFSSNSGGLLPQEIPYLALLSLGRSLGLTPSLSQALVFAAIMVVPGLAMWRLLAAWDLGTAGRFAGSLIYMLNPYVMILWHSGDPVELIAYGLAPWVMLLADMGRSREILPKWYWPSIGVLFLSLAAPAANPPTIIGNVLLPCLIFLLVRSRYEPGTLPLSRKVYRLVTGIGVGLLVNAWWALPVIISAAGHSLLSGFAGSFESQNPPELSVAAPMVDTLLNFGSWGWRVGIPGQLYYPFEPAYHTWLMWLIAALPLALAFTGSQLFLPSRRVRHRDLAASGGLVWVVGFFLAQGYHGLFGGAYTWAFHHLPLMIAFRSPWEKFEAMTVMGIALLSSIGTELLVGILSGIDRDEPVAMPLPMEHAYRGALEPSRPERA